MDWSGALVTPLVAAVVGIAVWFVQSRVEDLRREREKLHDDRRKVYADLLEPYIKMFAGINDPAVQEEVTRQILSPEYRKTSFEFSLLAADDVVKAFNDMMQFFFRAEAEGGQADPLEMLKRWGDFLLEIRKNVGDSNTKLTCKEMLRGQIIDIDRIM